MDATATAFCICNCNCDADSDSDSDPETDCDFPHETNNKPKLIRDAGKYEKYSNNNGNSGAANGLALLPARGRHTIAF